MLLRWTALSWSSPLPTAPWLRLAEPRLSVTGYEFTLDQGLKLSKVANLQDNIALTLGASSVRIALPPVRSPS